MRYATGHYYLDVWQMIQWTAGSSAKTSIPIKTYVVCFDWQRILLIKLPYKSKQKRGFDRDRRSCGPVYHMPSSTSFVLFRPGALFATIFYMI